MNLSVGVGNKNGPHIYAGLRDGEMLFFLFTVKFKTIL